MGSTWQADFCVLHSKPKVLTGPAMTSFVRVTQCSLFVVRIAIAVEPLKLRIQDLVVPGAVGRWKRKKKKENTQGVEEEMCFSRREGNRWLQMGEHEELVR